MEEGSVGKKDEDTSHCHSTIFIVGSDVSLRKSVGHSLTRPFHPVPGLSPDKVMVELIL